MRTEKAQAQTVEVKLHKLHPGQKAIAEHPARFRVVMCGRRFGKSALGIRLACDAARKGQPAVDVRVNSLSPTTPAMMRARQARRPSSRDSPRNSIPNSAVPAAPMPVHTA